MKQQWESDKMAAAGILANRKLRRRALGGFTMVMLLMLSVGLWVIDDWLKDHLLRFGIYWAGCGLLCLFVMLFALFDALSVIKEERDR